MFFLFGAAALLCLSVSLLHAQTDEGAFGTEYTPRTRIGIHGGLQTSLFRYSIFPYEGEFQASVEQSTVAGITIGLPFDEAFQLQVDIAWWEKPWSVFHDGDPRIEIARSSRSLIELPVMLQYRFIALPVPLYLAAGPVVSLVTDSEREYVISYTAFTERDGWRTSRIRHEEEILHFGLVGEVGIEVPLGAQLTMQTAVRLTHPLGKTVTSPELTLTELSVWRARLGVLYTL